MINRWEYSKSKSAYHFDKTIDEDGKPPFRTIGNVGLSLKDELQRMLVTYSTCPNTFTNRLSSQGISNSAPFTAKMDEEDLRVRGLRADHVTFENLNISGSPLMVAVAESFGMEPWAATIHLQYPGQTFPYHIDELPGLKQNKIDHWLDKHPEAAARFEVQLLDWEPGHVWAYGNTYWKQWKAGDIAFHEWRHIPHGTANIGRSVRATLQVTGMVSDITKSIIACGYGGSGLPRTEVASGT